MKTKILKVILPVIVGILVVLGVTFIFGLILNGEIISVPAENKFFAIFIPFTLICALLIQFLLTLPVWKKFKVEKKLFGLNLIQFTGVLIIICGIIFGLAFWEKESGIKDLLAVIATGIVAFAIYWTCNLLTLNKIH